MKFANYLFIYVLVIFSFLGCASTVVSVGPNTYMVTSDGAGFSAAGVRKEVIETANKFAKDRGLVMVPVSLKSVNGKLASNPPSAELVFRTLKSSDPEAQKVQNLSSGVSSIEILNGKANNQTVQKSKLAIYEELEKLNDLKKKNIITQEEFDAEKKKLLNN